MKGNERFHQPLRDLLQNELSMAGNWTLRREPWATQLSGLRIIGLAGSSYFLRESKYFIHQVKKLAQLAQEAFWHGWESTISTAKKTKPNHPNSPLCVRGLTHRSHEQLTEFLLNPSPAQFLHCTLKNALYYPLGVISQEICLGDGSQGQVVGHVPTQLLAASVEEFHRNGDS